MYKKIKLLFAGTLTFALILSVTASGIYAEDEESLDVDDLLVDGLTLDEAQQILLYDNAQIKSSEMALEKAEINHSDIMGDVNDVNYSSQESRAYHQGVELPTLNAEFQLANAERNLQATKEDVKAQLEQSFYQYQQAQENLKIREQARNVAQELHSQAQEKYELGTISKQEFIQSEMNEIKANMNYDEAVNGVKQARMSLNQQLGLELTNELTLDSELSKLESPDIKLDEAIEQALQNRNEVLAAQYQYEAAELNLTIIGKKFPDITYRYRNQEVSVLEAEQNLDNTKRRIEMGIRNNVMEIEQKEKKIRQNEKSVALAEEALKIAQVSYENGMNVVTDVEEAQKNLSQAKLGLSQAILEYNLAVEQFKDSTSQGRTAMNVGETS